MTNPTPTRSKPSMNKALKSFWRTRSRFKVLYGGRGSSKSWDAAANSVRIANDVKVRVLCTRMFQNRIEESVYTTIQTQIERFGLSHRFDLKQNKITNRFTGSEFLFYGIARNIKEIKSLEGVDILWIEEAESLTPEMWRILEPTIRKEGSEIWIIFNPYLATDFAYQTFVVNPPKNAVIRCINYDENPFLSETLLNTIDQLKQRDFDEYQHIYLGVPLTDDDNVIIKRSYILAAIDSHKKLGIEPSGSKSIGYDVADSGADMNAIAKRYGIMVTDTQEWKGLEDMLMESCKRVYSESVRFDANIVYDSIGVGAGCGSKFSEMNEASNQNIAYEGFNAGGKIFKPDREYKDGIKNKDQFSNIKAQAWWQVADRFRHTYEAVEKGLEYDPSMLISISSECSHLEKLITELSTPRKSFDGSGRVKVESKDDMAKRGVKSPNLADAFIMSFIPVINPKRVLEVFSL